MDVIEPSEPVGLERMVRRYFVQPWYGLADQAVRDAVYD